MPLKLWEKTFSSEDAQIIIICAGHPVLASASNDGWPPIKTYLFKGWQFCTNRCAVDQTGGLSLL